MDELDKKVHDALRQETKLTQDLINKYGIEQAAEMAQQKKVPYLPLRRIGQPYDQDAIVQRIAGGDMTDGSCASLGLCYVGQRAGYDVRDFRGGDSREIFAKLDRNILAALQNDGVTTIVDDDPSSVVAGARVLEQAVEGKEYFMACGQHASIVRRHNGELEYLELQSGKQNGWTPFSTYGVQETLQWRFGANDMVVDDIGREVMMADVDEMARSERLMNLLGYINTQGTDQQKGALGHER